MSIIAEPTDGLMFVHGECKVVVELDCVRVYRD